MVVWGGWELLSSFNHIGFHNSQGSFTSWPDSFICQSWKNDDWAQARLTDKHSLYSARSWLRLFISLCEYDWCGTNMVTLYICPLYVVLLRTQHFHEKHQSCILYFEGCLSGALAQSNQPSALTPQPVLCTSEKTRKGRKWAFSSV